MGAQKQWLYILISNQKRSASGHNNPRRYDKALKTEPLREVTESRRTQATGQCGASCPKWFSRWQQVQRVAEVGSEEVARDPKMRALRARLKKAVQALDV